MSSNDFNSDKTVFRQPSVTADRTVIKPMPGGRRAANAVSQTTATAAENSPSYQQPSMGLETEAAYFKTTQGLNPLVNAASILLAVFEKTKEAITHPDIAGLHQRMVNEIKSFEIRAKEQGIPAEIVLSARYILCTMLDEAVLNTPWGCESAWHQRSLLSIFHNETSGGEKFFLILDRLCQSPSENIYIIELFYISLSIGFEGKYRLSARGKESIQRIRDELFSIIRRYRGEYERELSPNWQGLGKTRNTMAHYVPLWVIGSVAIVILFSAYSGFRYWLYHSSVPVVNKLESIAQLKTDSTFNRIK